MRAAMSLPLVISSGAALVNYVAAWRLDRLECEPPPRLTRSASPVTRSMLSTGTASKAETTCAKLGLVTLAVWHCQLKQRWYASAVGGAVVRCGEVLGTPIGLSP
jgi:hypothetical protein